MGSACQGYIKTAKRSCFGNAVMVISGWQLLSVLRQERVGARFVPEINRLD
jgi:hypothetical protein